MTEGAEPNAIDQLFPALAGGRFVREYFPNEPYVHHGDLKRFGRLATDRLLQDPIALIQAARKDTLIGYLKMADGHRHQAVVTKATAAALYQGGMTVDVNSVHLWHDGVARFVEQLRTELGFRPDQIICDALVSPGGDAVPKHFDGIETMSIQLAGRKRWRVAPCTEVSFPNHSVFPGVAHNWRDGERQLSYAPASFTTSMPKKSRAVLMAPGSAQFLPRGWWHETSATGPTISLSVVLRTDTWSQILVRELSRALEEQSALRAPVSLATPDQRRKARQQLVEQVKIAAARLRSLAGDAVFPLSSDEQRFALAGQVTLSKKRRKEQTLYRLDAVGAERSVEFETDDDMVPVLQWLTDRREPFSRRELENVAGVQNAKGLVETLVDTGLLHVV